MRPETIAVSGGRGPEVPGAPLNVPVVLTSTYRAEGELTYGRDGNATWQAFEETLGALEGGRAVAFASGVAAIAAVVDMVPVGGRVVAPADSYSGTRKLLRELDRQKRLAVDLVDITDTDAVAEAAGGADLVWAESPTNPLLRLAELAQLAPAVKSAGARFAVDNTLATPLHQQPLSLGADLVVHSATKLIAGHSDLLMGAVVTADPELAESLVADRRRRGAVPGALEAFLALRGLRTLPVRLERSEATARELVLRLAAHPAVRRVHYPGFGAFLSFELDSREAADRVCEAVRLIVHATSLGGVESLIERRARWSGEDLVPETLIRLSVGLEHVEDLWDDLAQALSRA